MISRILLYRFVYMLVPLVILVGVYHILEKNSELQRIKITENNYLPAVGAQISAQFSDITAGLGFLAKSQQVIDYFDAPSTTTLTRLQEEFLAFSAAYGKFDQVRMLGLTGHELVRVNFVNGKAVLVSDEQLQNKADRYYFKDALSLNNGEVYISRFDLNIEQRQVEIPWKPMIRLTTPIFDSAGNRRGFLVLNYLGQYVLDMLGHEDKTRLDQLMLVNDQGYWLYHREEDKRWGFMFGQEMQFQTLYPAAWDRMLKDKKGQFQTVDGLFTYLTLYPAGMTNNINDLEVTLPNSDKWWKLISIIPDDEISPGATQRLTTMYKLSPVLFLLLLLIAWLWSRVEREAIRYKARLLELSRVVEQSREMVYITDPQGIIQYVNPAFEQTTGYTSEEAVGKTSSILKSGCHDDAFYSQLWETILDGKVFESIFENKRRDGTIYFEEKIISHIHDEKGNIVQFVSTSHDITERKQAEQQIHKLLQDNRSLTLRLFEAQEAERKHLARELHDELGQWLTAVQLHAQNISELIEDKTSKAYLSAKAIRECAEQMSNAARNIIRELRPQDLDALGLSDSLRELVALWQAHHPETECKLIIVCELVNLAEIVKITLYRTVQESLTNVAKYSQARHVSIHLRCELADSLMLTIKDDGKGMDVSLPSKGMGLAGMRERVLAAGGEFSLVSEPGKGVCIEVRLPYISGNE